MPALLYKDIKATTIDYRSGGLHEVFGAVGNDAFAVTTTGGNIVYQLSKGLSEGGLIDKEIQAALKPLRETAGMVKRNYDETSNERYHQREFFVGADEQALGKSVDAVLQVAQKHRLVNERGATQIQEELFQPKQDVKLEGSYLKKMTTGAYSSPQHRAIFFHPRSEEGALRIINALVRNEKVKLYQCDTNDNAKLHYVVASNVLHSEALDSVVKNLQAELGGLTAGDGMKLRDFARAGQARGHG